MRFAYEECVALKYSGLSLNPVAAKFLLICSRLNQCRQPGVCTLLRLLCRLQNPVLQCQSQLSFKLPSKFRTRIKKKKQKTYKKLQGFSLLLNDCSPLAHLLFIRSTFGLFNRDCIIFVRLVLVRLSLADSSEHVAGAQPLQARFLAFFSRHWLHCLFLSVSLKTEISAKSS